MFLFPNLETFTETCLFAGRSINGNHPRLRQRAKEVVKANDGTPDLQDKLLKGKGSSMLMVMVVEVVPLFFGRLEDYKARPKNDSLYCWGVFLG